MAKEIRTVEFVVLPATKAKATKMFQIAGTCRYVWNHFREKNLKDYQAFKNGKGERPKTSYFSLGVEFTKLRHKTKWMLELPANPIKHTLKYFADALGEAMAGKKGFPKPMSRKRTTPGFTLPSTGQFGIKKLGKANREIANKRKNWIHKTTKEISEKCGTVATEDLKVNSMTASAKGTIENPGKNVKQKAGLNREILNTAMGEIRRNLEYKCGRLIEVNPAYTSQTCSRCGHAEKENRKTQARFQCVSCGFVSNADTNAAINIRRLGMAQLHGEERSVCKRTPTTREIDTRLPYG